MLIFPFKFWQGLPLPHDSSVVCLAAASGSLWVLTDKGITDACPDGETWKEFSLAQLGKCNVIFSCEKYVSYDKH